jgi:hypothetical protein
VVEQKKNTSENRFQTQDNIGREKYTNANRKIFKVSDPDITGNFRIPPAQLLLDNTGTTRCIHVQLVSITSSTTWLQQGNQQRTYSRKSKNYHWGKTNTITQDSL